MAIISAVVKNLSVTGTGDQQTLTGGGAIFQVRGDTFINKFPGKAYAITSMFFCNRSNQAVNINIYLVPEGRNPSSFTIMIKELALNNGDTFSFDTEKIILGEYDALWASCDVDGAVNVFLSVVQVQ